MSKLLSLLPLPSNILLILNKAGYTTVGDLKGSTVDDLAAELKVPISEAAKILQSVESRPVATPSTTTIYTEPSTNGNEDTIETATALKLFPASQSAAAMLANLKIAKTPDEALNNLVGGGLRKGTCLEIAGPPGSGKGSLALEFIRGAVDEDMDVLIVDCQNSMHPSRIVDALDENAKHSIHRVCTNGYAEFFSFLNQLPSYLSSHPKISLVFFSVLSNAFQLIPNHTIKSRLLNLLKAKLTTLNIISIATVQLSTKLQNPDGSAANFDTAGAKAMMLPSLNVGNDGESGWFPLQRSYRILLWREADGSSYLRVTATPMLKDSNAKSLSFTIDNGRVKLSTV
ncbi:hypothetical protein FRC19_000610 [Serendipita sp. 401]|nr:hypothetical protein FRC19_000610 [Serendipita sp. 401]